MQRGGWGEEGGGEPIGVIIRFVEEGFAPLWPSPPHYPPYLDSVSAIRTPAPLAPTISVRGWPVEVRALRTGRSHLNAKVGALPPPTPPLSHFGQTLSRARRGVYAQVHSLTPPVPPTYPSPPPSSQSEKESPPELLYLHPVTQSPIPRWK